MARVPKLLDVSVPLAAGMPAYPGNPDFELQPIKRIAQGGSSNVSRLVLGTHTGTHVDAPSHFIDDAASVDGLPLELLMGRARVVEITTAAASARESSQPPGCERTSASCSRHPTRRCGTADVFHEDYTHLTESGARYLVEQGVKVVGIDYVSIEQFRKPGAPAHRMLLSNGVIIIEGLNLADAEPGHVRDVLPAPAGQRGRRRTGARRAQAMSSLAHAIPNRSSLIADPRTDPESRIRHRSGSWDRGSD